jgi:hypothetical protein
MPVSCAVYLTERGVCVCTGKSETGLMHIADWKATFAALAGAHPFDFKAAANGLPPIDSLNHWPMLATGQVSQCFS